MILAIVYNSYAGHTKEYASMLAESTGLPILNIDDAMKLLPKNSQVIFLSWVKNGKLEKYPVAKKYFKIPIVVPVGICEYKTELDKISFIGYNNIDAKNVFFLKGGIDLDKFSPKTRTKFVNFSKKLKEKYSKNGKCSVEDYEFVDMLEKGANYTSKKNLKPIIECLKSPSYSI